MSALPKFDIFADRRSPNAPKSTPLISSPQQPLPTALQVLLSFQQATSLVTLAIVCAGLGIYGWTVYTPQLWSEEYQQLKALQKTERQLIANTEAIKHQLAREAERPSSGLVDPHPDQNIFLPTKQRDGIAPHTQNIATTPSTLSFSVKPIAY